MKKVLVLLVAAALLTAPAFGAIRNSKHDLSTSGAQTISSLNTDETCVFCHTPHGGITNVLAPLWNRTAAAVGFVVGDLYNSATLEAGVSNPAAVIGAVNASDAPLCFSCHDGASLAGGLANNPASNGNQPPTFGANPLDRVGTESNLDGSGAALRNDHPIGMDYSDAATAVGSGLFPEAAVIAANLPLYTYGADNVMWCSTCHDVHNQGGGQPFLNMSNAGSAMCTTCHDK